MLTVEDILHAIEDGGYRATGSRRRLLETLAARGEGFTAEELVGEVRGVGRATVYRTIRLLLRQGLLCKLTLQDGAPRYSLSRVGHHHHVVCVRCGAVRDFRQSVIERILKDLEVGEGSAVVGHRIEVYVVCPGCREAGVATSPTAATG
ncbi:MAG: transcriptional repressor [Chloroflexi bacterium]|nr:transcriptional repressor [Chloroflexota bacterium]